MLLREVLIKSWFGKETVSFYDIDSETKILDLKKRYEEGTNIPKEDFILKNWEGKIMDDEKELSDYGVKDQYPKNMLSLESKSLKSKWFLHYINSTKMCP